VSRLAEIDFTDHDRCVVARLQGEIDQSNTRMLGEALTDGLANESMALVLDLSEIDYFDSAGIQLIYELRGNLEARGQQLRLVIPAGSPSRAALELAGVSRHVALFETAAAALDGAAP
jgi:anti-sigma B factor antagonist